ncbi:centrosomal protein of 131 kDa-like [Asterias rubens]|uniref:centrosomal protein of 131 kDa-like n=1 Tax=Asterias rubens TaxID=7604 RepID=UPI001455117A|nr:centrosomal protein of 131 kDa-like [Asterias rubens]
MDLSLTGSQISSIKRPSSAGSRPGSSNGGRQGTSGGRTTPKTSNHVRTSSSQSSVVTGGGHGSSARKPSPGRSRPERTNSTSGVTNGLAINSSSLSNGRHKRTSSHNAELSHRSNASEDSSRASARSREAPSSSATDFLALFDSGHQPVIKNRSSKPKKASTRNHWTEPPSGRAFAIPSSARSSSTIDSYTLNSGRHDTTRETPRGAPALQLNAHTTLLSKQENQKTSPQSVDAMHLLKNSMNTNNTNLDSTPPAAAGDAQLVSSSEKNFRASSPRKTSNTTSKRLALSTPRENDSRNSARSPRRDQVPLSPTHPVAETYIESVNEAAGKIQRWYRTNVSKRQRDGEEEIRKILNQKRREREELLQQQQKEEEAEVRREGDKKRSREEKARLARHAAIEELQKKREEKAKDIREKAEEEIRYLQASGKVSKKPAPKPRPRSSSNSSKKQRGESVKPPPEQATSSRTPDEMMGAVGGTVPRPATASSVGRKVDEIFDDPSTHRTQQTEDEPSGTPSVAATKTTLTDLLDTLKLLEEPVKVPSPSDNNKKGPAWLDILDDREEDDDEDAPALSHRLAAERREVYLSAENIQQISGKPKPKPAGPKPSEGGPKVGSQHALLTEDKLMSIMSFLDEVDQADKEEIVSQVMQFQDPEASVVSQSVLVVPSAAELQKLEQASAAASEVTNTVLSQRLQLDEKDRSVKMLQKALNQQRELTVRHAKEQEKEMKKRLGLQKEEYENTVKRHLSFIDQLIDDKKSLSEKYDTVVRDLKQVDKKYSTKIKTMEDTHNSELQKVKDVQAAAEKIRREKWIDEKTKKIKEITVKGLEPEIQRLIASHKGEIKKIKAIHEAELLQSEERAGGKYVRHIEELRDQLAEEKEAACARERDLAKTRYEKQLEQEEAAYQQQRRRLYADIQEEKERLADQAKRQRQEMDRLTLQMEDNNRKGLGAMKEEFEQARDEQERRHRAEVRELEERLKIEKEAWEENYMKKQETWLLSKERELKEHVRKDRDKEIELVITRLEDDAATAREECERAAENRVKRIRDKYEAELREIELSERNTQDRYNDMKARLADVEGETIRLKGLMKQKEQEVQDVKKICDRLTNERNNVQDVIRQEFADRLVATEEENKRLKNEMSEMRARHKLELSRIKESKDEEMEEVHKRVKQAIVKKEETVSQLKQQHAAAVKRADHLESLLEQQRKQLIKK